MRRAAIAVVAAACGSARPAPEPAHLEHTAAGPDQPPPALFAALFDPARTWSLPEVVEIDGTRVSRGTVTCRVAELSQPARDTWRSKIACDHADPTHAGLLPQGTYVATLHGLWRFPGEAGELTDDAMVFPTPPVPAVSKTTRIYEFHTGVWCNQTSDNLTSTVLLCIQEDVGLVTGGGTAATQSHARSVTWGQGARNR